MRHENGIRIGDVLLMLSLLLTAVLLLCLPLLSRNTAQTVEIIYAGTDVIEQYPLGQDGSYPVTSGGVSLTVTVTAGEVRVTDADCKDQVCVHTPAISRGGQSIVCAPAGVVVRVVGEGADADAISG